MASQLKRIRDLRDLSSRVAKIRKGDGEDGVSVDAVDRLAEEATKEFFTHPEEPLEEVIPFTPFEPLLNKEEKGAPPEETPVTTSEAPPDVPHVGIGDWVNYVIESKDPSPHLVDRRRIRPALVTGVADKEKGTVSLTVFLSIDDVANSYGAPSLPLLFLSAVKFSSKALLRTWHFK